MSEAAENTEILAHIGRKQIELENSRIAFLALDREYTHLLSLLSGVLSGEIERDQVSIDLAARSWKVEPKANPEDEVLPKV